MLRTTFFATAVIGGVIALPGTASADLQGTCVNVHREGPVLVATCQTASGGYRTSSIPLGSCPPGAIGNINGRLTCTAGGGGYGGGYDGGYGRPRFGF